MQTITAVDPARITIADLEVLEAKQSVIAPAPKPITARDARHQVLGAIKIIARMSGMDMTRDVHPTELLVQRIDELEAQVQTLRDQAEAEKSHYQNQVGEYRRVLRNISVVLDGHSDPFEKKVASKWTKTEMGQRLLDMFESMKWAIQRVDNLLDPVNAVKIADDPEPDTPPLTPPRSNSEGNS